MSNRPIGIFDSGIGGLTVVKEVLHVLPNENIIYFGDTARVPYGTKSKETITRFAKEDANFLISKKVKAIVVACNTVSSNSLESLNKTFNIPILGVIEPGAECACRETRNKKIGVIGTSATIESAAYKINIKKYCPDVTVYCKSCPLLVPLAEEGWIKKEATYLIVKEYLNELLALGIDTLVLGCTHYPILKPVIKNVVGTEVHLIDASYFTAVALKKLLVDKGILRVSKSPNKTSFYLSDIPRGFSAIGERFLGRKITNISVVDITK
ncbi:MAG: glutamate racemase [Candidatus Cloacimonas sp. 4484_209]|nr:MAG: glutamate racemase [Candidatus Cloacimonas sp. 4484_209]